MSETSTGFLSLMAIPFLECLVLVGIHSYLGLHVIRRRVIFVDLALAQVAALGTTVAFLFGLNPHSQGAYVFSIIFTFIAAGVFALTRLRRDRVPQEAVIGLAYALAASVGILVVFGAPHGAEHIQEISTGALLWVRPEEVVKAALVYLFVGVVHVVFRRQFTLISEDPDGAYHKGLCVRGWDFLFYLLFGLVITHSVQTAGVLLVFVFLVVPAIIGVLLTDRMWLQLVIGWGVGTLVSMVGLAASYYGDLPSGPTVVAFYGLALLLIALTVYVVRSARPWKALGFIGTGLGVVTVLVVALWSLGSWFSGIESMALSPQELKGHEHGVEPEPEPITRIDEGELGRFITALEPLDLVDKRAFVASYRDADQLDAAWHHTRDVEARLALGERLLALERKRGALLLHETLASAATPPVLRDEALSLLRQAYSVGDQGLDPFAEPGGGQSRKALDAWLGLIKTRSP